MSWSSFMSARRHGTEMGLIRYTGLSASLSKGENLTFASMVRIPSLILERRYVNGYLMAVHSPANPWP